MFAAQKTGQPMMNQESSGNVGRRRWSFRAGLHIVMGILYLILAGVVIYYRKFGTLDLGNSMAFLLGGLLALYGLFRIWRGWQDYKDSGIG
jgi:hypothetical protein